jgi:hypothetical protein
MEIKIEGFEDYAVSSEGCIISYKHKRKVLRCNNDTNGYPSVSLWNNSKFKSFNVHRIVARYFVKNDDPINKTDVGHWDEIKTNNHYTNLYWCTRKENINHSVRNGTFPKGERAKSKLTTVEVQEIKALLRQGVRMVKIYPKYNVSQYCIWSIKHELTWKHVL